MADSLPKAKYRRPCAAKKPDPQVRFRRQSFEKCLSLRHGVRQQNAAVYLIDVSVAAQSHADIEFFVDDLQGLAHTGFAHGAQTVQHGATDVCALCAQRLGF